MSAHEEYLDDIALLALGGLTEPQANAVRAHLAQCEPCSAEYDSFREVADVLPLAAPAPESMPGPEIKARVMAGIQAQPSAREPIRAAAARRAHGRAAVLPAYLLAAACLAAAILFGARYERLNRQLMHANAIVADVTAPDASHFNVIGGQIIRRADHIYLAMGTAPPPPRGKVYQAWTLPVGSKRMAPSVTFVPKNGHVLLRLPVDALRVAAIAVSAEPPGGSTQPTSKPLFVVLFKASKA